MCLMHKKIASTISYVQVLVTIQKIDEQPLPPAQHSASWLLEASMYSFGLLNHFFLQVQRRVVINPYVLTTFSE